MDLQRAIEMAEEVGVHEYGPLTRNWSFNDKQLLAFATSIEAKTLSVLASATSKVAPDLTAQLVERVTGADRALDDFLKVLRAEPSCKDARIVCGAYCTWWDSIDKIGRHRGNLPCCPYCRRMLLEFSDLETFMCGVDDFERQGHADYRAFIEWLRGKCFSRVHIALDAYKKETGKGCVI